MLRFEIFFATNIENIGVLLMIVQIWKWIFLIDNKFIGFRSLEFVSKVFREILRLLGIFWKLFNFVPNENLIWLVGWMKSVVHCMDFDISRLRVDRVHCLYDQSEFWTVMLVEAFWYFVRGYSFFVSLIYRGEFPRITSYNKNKNVLFVFHEPVRSFNCCRPIKRNPGSKIRETLLKTRKLVKYIF